MYELRIYNKYNFGNRTFKSDSLQELHNKLHNLIVDGEVKIYEVNEIKPSWINDYTKYDPSKHELNNVDSRILYDTACITYRR